MAAYTIVPIDHAIKQAITAAVRAVEFKKYHVEPDDVVNALLTDIFVHLFPYNPSLVDVNKVETQYIPIEPVPAAAEAVALPASPKPAKEKKPRAKKAAEPAPEPVANAAAGSASAAPEEKPKKGRAKKSEAQNLDKLNPTQKKVLKKEAAEPKDFLDYVNGLTEEAYKAKTFEEHVQEFKKPKVEVVPYEEPNLVPTEHNGKTYWVDPDSKKVYVQDGDVDKLVGHVGMQEFVGMVVPA